ncbi:MULTISPECIES: site-specific integrase [Cobetia]|uniref:site-specific integrase n=1 Tax=Cobetia TaxID=204286 RepID=UPI001582FE2C|nr:MULTISPECIES: site-specific integrase [Cobetia]MDI4659571.1 site-specific integrase [Cobetia sp. BMC6]NUJ56120.1 site-specific integrase [Cobetia marina]
MPYGTYLIRSRHASQWYARIIIPHDVREHFRQRREIRKTLNTSCKKTAKRRVLLVWLAYQDVFDALRKGQPVTTVFPTDWGALADLTTAIQPLKVSTPRDFGAKLTISHIEPLKAHRVSSGETLVVELVTINPVTGEITVKDATDGDIKLMKELAPHIWSQQGRQEGLATSVLPQTQPDALPLSEMWDGFVEESMTQAKQKSQQSIRQALSVLIEIVGDLPANKLDKQVVRLFIKELASYPAQRTKGKRKSLTLNEIRAGDHKVISPRTQINIINNLHNFAGWLVEIGKLDSNPFTQRKKQQVKQPPRRKTWTEDELALWFSSDLYLKHKNSTSERWKYWLPLLGIYSGARLEELAALAPKDISEHGGIHFFEIHARDNRSVKNASSWRYVPLHSHLIKLGFLDYVISRKGEERLFSLVPYNGEYGKSASKAFGYIRQKLGIEPTFHGYRHTVAEALRIKNTQTEHISWLLGHSGKTMTDHYGSDADKRYRLPLLSKAVERLDWSHIFTITT